MLPPDYTATFSEFDIRATVLVEALAGYPLRELQEAETWRQSTGGRIATAVIAHAPLDSPRIGTVLDRYRDVSPAFRGIRDIISAGPRKPSFARSPDLLTRPAFRDGLAALAQRDLVFDLMLDPTQLEAAAALLLDIPELSVAIEHAGHPRDRTPDGRKQWRVGMARLADRPNTIVKVSALQVHDPNWTVESLSTVVCPLVDLFGVQRLCFGTDYPVHDLACPGPVAIDAMLDVTEDWAASDQSAFFHGTATSFYGLADHESKQTRLHP